MPVAFCTEPKIWPTEYSKAEHKRKFYADLLQDVLDYYDMAIEQWEELDSVEQMMRLGDGDYLALEEETEDDNEMEWLEDDPE